jgi:hypothetical protein
VARFDPSPAEISVIEQIETAFNDDSLVESRRAHLLKKLWVQLERVHGSRVLMLQSPEGQVIQSPVAQG